MRLAPMLIAASSALVAVGTRQSLATPTGPAPARAAIAPWAGGVVPVAGIPRFPARPRPAPPAPVEIDARLLRVRPPLAPGMRECPMPVAGAHVAPPHGGQVEEAPAVVPGRMPIAQSACVNPLAR